MSEAAADKRREAFIADIVEVCKKHRVMMETPEDWWGDEFSFTEDTLCPSGYGFMVDLGEIEKAVRLAVWPILHGGDGE